MNPSNALAIPDNADTLPAAQEVLRVWITDEGERVALHVHPAVPVGAWGILLADLARHAARAYAQKGQGSPTENLRVVMAQLLLEFKSPSDEVRGEIGG